MRLAGRPTAREKRRLDMYLHHRRPLCRRPTVSCSRMAHSSGERRSCAMSSSMKLRCGAGPSLFTNDRLPLQRPVGGRLLSIIELLDQQSNRCMSPSMGRRGSCLPAWVACRHSGCHPGCRAKLAARSCRLLMPVLLPGFIRSLRQGWDGRHRHRRTVGCAACAWVGAQEVGDKGAGGRGGQGWGGTDRF